MEETTIRINKYLANLGICSRRDVKQLLHTHTLTVNGERIKEPGTRINPYKDDVKFNGNKIKAPELVYYLINKPKGIISTTADEFGRKNVLSLITTRHRLYPVGRLDKDTTGLLLLTNDGALTNLLTHPKYHVDKVYALTIEGRATKEQLRALRNGVLLEDGITYPAEVKIVKENNMNSLLEMTIHEGRNRQIRRMCETVGVKLLELKRIKFGPINLDIKVWKYRELTKKELNALRKATTKPKINANL
ncbi:MAG: pseudouridine synthase [Candidatus Levyibacteriota bacterium]